MGARSGPEVPGRAGTSGSIRGPTERPRTPIAADGEPGKPGFGQGADEDRSERTNTSVSEDRRRQRRNAPPEATATHPDRRRR
jgi:hypothetical protein